MIADIFLCFSTIYFQKKLDFQLFPCKMDFFRVPILDFLGWKIWNFNSFWRIFLKIRGLLSSMRRNHFQHVFWRFVREILDEQKSLILKKIIFLYIYCILNILWCLCGFLLRTHVAPLRFFTAGHNFHNVHLWMQTFRLNVFRRCSFCVFNIQ